jgi:hypothetical protein
MGRRVRAAAHFLRQRVGEELQRNGETDDNRSEVKK